MNQTQPYIVLAIDWESDHGALRSNVIFAMNRESAEAFARSTMFGDKPPSDKRFYAIIEAKR